MESITFIIPTIGRDTLLNSINCLKNQTIKLWKAIIIYDGIKSNINNSDPRIKIIEIDKAGIDKNSAGNVRNHGISFVDTKWIAFLDDDDLIDNDYIETFYNELKLYPSIDVLIFRMAMDNRIVPELKTDNFYLCDVGISFIIKREICDNNILFEPDSVEDFLFLDKIRENNYEMMISPYVKYFVKNKVLNKSENMIGNRVFINMENDIIMLFGYLLFTKDIINFNQNNIF
jgi:glycosyltransferase involved in cell wall biosynthesis